MPDNNTVIVATDGSDHSLRVLPHAAILATNLGAGLELLRVVERREVSSDESAAVARIESEMAADLKHFGLDAKTRAVVTPADASVATTLLSQSADAALLAMHSRGRGGVARLLQGSVALGVLKLVSVPVLLGGPELLPPPATSDTYRLLVTTDLSPDADFGLKAVAPLLERGKFAVTLLYIHLHAPAGIDNEAQKAEREAALNQKRSLLPAGVPVDVVLREIPIGGGIDTAIMEVAAEAGAQAIAMATHGHSARHHLIMGSVALSVLGRSRLPVIVARAQG